MRCEIRKERIPFVKQLNRFMNKAPSKKPIVHTDDRRYLSFFAFKFFSLPSTWREQLQLVVERRGRELEIFCVV
jgi:hypothetical protein